MWPLLRLEKIRNIKVTDTKLHLQWRPVHRDPSCWHSFKICFEQPSFMCIHKHRQSVLSSNARDVILYVQVTPYGHFVFSCGYWTPFLSGPFSLEVRSSASHFSRGLRVAHGTSTIRDSYPFSTSPKAFSHYFSYNDNNNYSPSDVSSHYNYKPSTPQYSRLRTPIESYSPSHTINLHLSGQVRLSRKPNELLHSGQLPGSEFGRIAPTRHSAHPSPYSHSFATVGLGGQGVTYGSAVHLSPRSQFLTQSQETYGNHTSIALQDSLRKARVRTAKGMRRWENEHRYLARVSLIRIWRTPRSYRLEYVCEGNFGRSQTHQNDINFYQSTRKSLPHGYFGGYEKSKQVGSTK